MSARHVRCEIEIDWDPPIEQHPLLEDLAELVAQLRARGALVNIATTKLPQALKPKKPTA